MTENHMRNNKIKSIFIGAALIWALPACNYAGNKSGIHWFLDMHDHPGVEAQEEDFTTLDILKGAGWWKGSDSIVAFGGPGSSMRVPPEGSVPMNYEPYPYESDEIEKAGAELKNPLPNTRVVLERGQKMFNANCAICHGVTGVGNGSVAPRMPTTPPNLVAGAAKDWEDGKIFHLITMGRATMKPYAQSVLPADRWAIIHYIRLLQANAR